MVDSIIILSIFKTYFCSLPRDWSPQNLSCFLRVMIKFNIRSAILVLMDRASNMPLLNKMNYFQHLNIYMYILLNTPCTPVNKWLVTQRYKLSIMELIISHLFSYKSYNFTGYSSRTNLEHITNQTKRNWKEVEDNTRKLAHSKLILRKWIQ